MHMHMHMYMYVLEYLLSVICYLLSVICYLLSVSLESEVPTQEDPTEPRLPPRAGLRVFGGGRTRSFHIGGGQKLVHWRRPN